MRTKTENQVILQDARACLSTGR